MVIERRLATEASKKAMEAAGLKWEESSWEETHPWEERPDVVTDEEALVAIRKYRASLVQVVLPENRLETQFSAYWKLGEIASRRLGRHICDVGPNKNYLLGCPRAHTDPNQKRRAFRWESPYFTADEKSNRQVAYVTTNFHSRPFVPSEHFRAQMDPARCAPLVDFCPELAVMERVAFIYRAPEVDNNVSYRFWPGLEHLWPFNLPSLKELYLIAESISLQDGLQSPPESTSKIDGYMDEYLQCIRG
ncbi:hypothetical protein B0I37DRAFT_433033 [Chaetomium sp. MPI-CAGE-AT-0009]|nr:hypothetical protein B0I37DRAFT_433033 [Chaetomium sp. MPI-CAGE-AT-0009]